MLRLRTIWRLSNVFMYLELRNGIALFFNFAFPLLLLAIFSKFGNTAWTTVGLLFSSYNSAVTIGLPLSLSVQRDQKILLQLKLAPIKITDYILALSFHTTKILFAQTLVILGLSSLIFGSKFYFDISYLPALLLITIPGLLALFSIGFIISALGKSMKMTNVIATINNMIFIFLPPIFFPASMWKGTFVEHIVQLIPLTPMVNIFRDVLVFNRVDPNHILPALYYLLPVTIITFYLAVKTFSYYGIYKFRGKVYSVN